MTANDTAPDSAPDTASGVVAEAAAGKDAASYRTALKATSLTGSSALLVSGLMVVKSKVIAVLLGPSGIGLFGLLSSAAALVGALVGLGINSSGGRQVAAAVARKDEEKVARVVYTLRRTSLLLGVLGAVAVAAFSRPIAKLSTGHPEYAGALAILGLAVLFQTVNGGQTALLRGLRRIGDLARLRILGALAGTLVAIPMVWAWGSHGVAPAIVTVAAFSMLASWYYARQVKVASVRLTLPQLREEMSGLVGLGAVFLCLGIASSVMQYVLRAILARTMDLGAVGQFQAATALSLVYVTFILQAMGLDFMPRLTGVAADHAASNRLVNEQSEISLLLAGPGIIATAVLAPLIIPLLYSAKFAAAVELLRIQCFGVLLRVASWPIAYVLVAKGKRLTYLWTELSAHALHLACFWFFTRAWGLMGAAAAFTALYVFFLPLDYLVVRRLTGFSWTAGTVKVLLVMVTALAAATASIIALPGLRGSLAGVAIAVATGVFSLHELTRRTDLPAGRLAARAVAALAAVVRPGARRGV